MESSASIVVDTKPNPNTEFDTGLPAIAPTAKNEGAIAQLAHIPPVRHRDTPTSRPFMQQVCTLNSQPAQAVFDQTFYRTDNSLYIVSSILRVIASNEIADKLIQTFDVEMTKTIEELKVNIERYKKLITDNGIEHIVVGFSKPTTIEARVGSPRAARYLNMIKTFDGLVQQMEQLVFGSVMSEQERNDVSKIWINTFRRMSRKFMNHERSARGAARRLKQGKGKDSKAKLKAITKDLGAEVTGHTTTEAITTETQANTSPIAEVVTMTPATVEEEAVAEEKTKRRRKAK